MVASELVLQRFLFDALASLFACFDTLLCLGSTAAEADRFVAGLQDVAVVREPVQQRGARRVMPLCHANSLYFGTTFAHLGGTCHIEDRKSFDPEALLRTLAGDRVTFTSLVPTHYISNPANCSDSYPVGFTGLVQTHTPLDKATAYYKSTHRIMIEAVMAANNGDVLRSASLDGAGITLQPTLILLGRILQLANLSKFCLYFALAA